MKIRSDFVTNSSSSSFIVGFRETPTNVKALKTVLFGDSPYLSPYDASFPTSTVATTIFNDMERDGKIRPLTRDEIYDVIVNGGGSLYWLDYRDPEFPYRAEGENFHETMDKWYKELEKYRKKVFKDFMARVEKEDLKVFVFNYGDDDEYYGAIEHGGTFDRLLPNVVHLSHH